MQEKKDFRPEKMLKSDGIIFLGKEEDFSYFEEQFEAGNSQLKLI